jgi:quercetin dioxygenase-like cupin family protein
MLKKRIRLIAAATALAIGPAVAQDYPAARPLLTAGITVTGEPIHYPAGAAQVSASVVTVPPGRETGWHRHGVPLFAYILAGELTVDYGAQGARHYKTGDAFLEAMATAHNGRNQSTEPVSILVVYMGAEGTPEVLPDK